MSECRVGVSIHNENVELQLLPAQTSPILPIFVAYRSPQVVGASL